MASFPGTDGEIADPPAHFGTWTLNSGGLGNAMLDYREEATQRRLMVVLFGPSTADEYAKRSMDDPQPYGAWLCDDALTGEAKCVTTAWGKEIRVITSWGEAAEVVAIGDELMTTWAAG